MANTGVPAGKAPKKPAVSKQGTPGASASDNELTSNARVVKPASSNLMKGMSQNRGAGGAK